MTLLEAIKATIGMDAPEATILKAFADNGGVESSLTESYNPATDKDRVNAIAADVLLVLQSSPDISEGDYSIKQNKDGIAARLKALQGTTTGATIQDISYLW